MKYMSYPITINYTHIYSAHLCHCILHCSIKVLLLNFFSQLFSISLISIVQKRIIKIDISYSYLTSANYVHIYCGHLCYCIFLRSIEVLLLKIFSLLFSLSLFSSYLSLSHFDRKTSTNPMYTMSNICKLYAFPLRSFFHFFLFVRLKFCY